MTPFILFVGFYLFKNFGVAIFLKIAFNIPLCIFEAITDQIILPELSFVLDKKFVSIGVHWWFIVHHLSV